jgi:capsid protein
LGAALPLARFALDTGFATQEFNAMKLAIRAGLTSRSEAISAYGYDAEDVDREIAADNARADALGLVFDSDPRHDQVAAPAEASSIPMPSSSDDAAVTDVMSV